MPVEYKDILSPIIDLCSAIWLDEFKREIQQKIDEKKLKKDISVFIENQEKYHVLSGNIDSEFDFEGLLNYLQTELMKDCEQFLFDPNKKIRSKANDRIIENAINWALPKYPESTDRVKSIINDVLAIIGGFYKQKVKPEDYYLASKIIDATLDGAKDLADDESNKIVDRVGQQFENATIYPRLTKNGTPDQQNLDGFLKYATAHHKLFPYYGVSINNGKFCSIPLTKEASEKYPVNYKITGRISDGQRYFNDINLNPLEYAMNHQVRLYVDVQSIKKYLGDVVDPNQGDIENVVGSKIVIEPGKLSRQIPVALRITEHNEESGELVTNTYYDNLLFQINEILEDGTIIIGNRNQDDSSVNIEIKSHLDKKDGMYKSSDFQIHLNNGSTHHDSLTYKRLIRALYKKSSVIHIYNLETKKDIVSGTITSKTDKDKFKNLDNDIRFLEDVCKVEDYFGVGLNINGIVNSEDSGIIYYLARLTEGQYTAKWESLVCEGIVDESLRSGWGSMLNDDKAVVDNRIGPLVFCCQRSVDVEIFDAMISFEEQVTYDDAYFDDVMKTRKKLSALDDGDPIKVKLVAGNGHAIVTEKLL